MTTEYGRRGGQGVKYAGGASPVALWLVSSSVVFYPRKFSRRSIEVRGMAKVKVMVVILLIGIASPFLG